jgi:hypothetical protein
MLSPEDYFAALMPNVRRKYEALRAFFVDGKPAAEVATEFDYALSSFYTLSRDFRKHLRENPEEDFFFKEIHAGRRPLGSVDEIDKTIIALRKKNYSAPDIETMMAAMDFKVSYGYIYNLIRKEGFARLPRRSRREKADQNIVTEKAPKAELLHFSPERFTTSSAGLLLFLPYLSRYRIDEVLANSSYPGTSTIPRLNSLLCFLALKLDNVRRYSADDLWCMDRGPGLFAGLNVLPKNAWFSSYSHNVTRQMNLELLRNLHSVWVENDLLSDTANLDFVTIPYWGDDQHLENNWSGKRNKAMGSMLAVLAQDPETGIIDYGDTDVMHKNQNAVILEFLDFYRETPSATNPLKYLVFDSKFTNYENLGKLDEKEIKFLTIRRRGKKIVERIDNLSKTNWKTIRVEAAGNKKRTIKAMEEYITLPGYRDGKQIRQVCITGHGKIKPALIITNDFDLKMEEIIRKYARRWLVEKTIAEQTDFFHLNRLSSSMVIKVDFDLTMTILAHNLYRLLARDLGRYANSSDIKIYDKFIANNGAIVVDNQSITVELKKKRDLPQILEMTPKFNDQKYAWLQNKTLQFTGASNS